MIIKQFTLGPIEDNNYLLIDEASKEAVLIDCTEESAAIEKAISDADANLKYILITHGHFDHILGINSFKAKYPNCKVLAHEDDKELLESIEEFASRFGLGKVELQHIDRYLKDGEIVKFGSYEVAVIHTPGHTKGGVCYLVNDNVGGKIFTGDTLFYESVGRTDLPGGSFAQIKSSIEQRLFTLDESIKVYPGHGILSTIGHEKANNRFM